jgi:hypothetical protein
VKHKFAEMILAGLLKRVTGLDIDSVDTDFTIPMLIGGTDEVYPHEIGVKINLKCENVKIRIEKE